MTNNTKKRTHSQQDRRSDPPSTAVSTESRTLEELRERNEELERRLRKYKESRKVTKSPTIKPIIRPKGEAGSRKRGFILYDAMEMDNVENGRVVYDRMRNSVRQACIKVGLSFSAHYKYQDHEKLGQVFLLVRKSYPYLTTARFPHNWAIADMVKGYIAGTRKEHNRQVREEENERDGATARMKLKKRRKDSDVHEPSDHEPEEDEDEIECNRAAKKTTHLSSTKSKKSPSYSDIDETGEREFDDDTHGTPDTSGKSKKRRRSDSDFYATEPEGDPPSQTSTKSTARSSTSTSTTRTLKKRTKSDPDTHASEPEDDAHSHPASSKKAASGSSTKSERAEEPRRSTVRPSTRSTHATRSAHVDSPGKRRTTTYKPSNSDDKNDNENDDEDNDEDNDEDDEVGPVKRVSN